MTKIVGFTEACRRFQITQNGSFAGWGLSPCPLIAYKRKGRFRPFLLSLDVREYRPGAVGIRRPQPKGSYPSLRPNRDFLIFVHHLAYGNVRVNSASAKT